MPGARETMARLHQLRLQYVAAEDRALLLVSTTARQEYRFWLTRRLVKALWPVLERALANDEAVRRHGDAGTRDAVLAFRHEQAVRAADFATEYQGEGLEHPLGETPLLVARARISADGAGNHRVALAPRQGQGIEFHIASSALHSLSRLVADTARMAEWDLAIGLEVTPVPRSPDTRPN